MRLALRVLGLSGLALVLGTEALAPIPDGETPCAPARTTPLPVAAAPPELPPYEVSRRTTSPDGATWCILHVNLQAEAATETLRAAWADLRRQETTEWQRFTCRFSWPEGSVDVNELMVLYGVPLEPQEPVRLPRFVRDVLAEEGRTPGDGEIVIVEEGEDYVIFEVEGVEIRVEKRR